MNSDSQATVPLLEERIERLEVQNRRLAAGLSAAVLAGVLLAALGAAHPKPAPKPAPPPPPPALVASNLDIRDKAGKTRIALGLDPDGAPALTLFDPGGQPRAKLLIDTEGAAALHLMDSTGNMLINAGVASGGSSTIQLLDSSGDARALLTYHDGYPQLAFFDPAGDGRAGLGLDADGTPALLLRGHGQKWGVLLKADNSGANSLAIYDRAENPRVQLGTDARDTVVFSLFDKSGKPLTPPPAATPASLPAQK